MKKFYCSKECQQNAWKEHQHSCVVAPPPDNSLRVTSRHDERHTRYISKFVFNRHLPGLRALAKAKFPHESMDQLGLHINFNIPSIGFDVFKQNGPDPIIALREIYPGHTPSPAVSVLPFWVEYGKKPQGAITLQEDAVGGDSCVMQILQSISTLR